MKRLWYVDIEKREDAVTIRLLNVFDGCAEEEPLSARASGPADVAAILHALKPLCRIPLRYMEINGLGSLLRIASLPRVSLDELVAQALENPHSVLVTPLLTREEAAWCLSRRREDPARERK